MASTMTVIFFAKTEIQHIITERNVQEKKNGNLIPKRAAISARTKQNWQLNYTWTPENEDNHFENQGV